MRQWLIDLRNEKQLTRKDVADKLGVDTTYIQKIETAQRTPSVSVAMKMGKILGFEWNILYETEEQEEVKWTQQ